MKHEFYLHFDQGLPRTTAQEKGETIKYKRVGSKLVPYIAHFRKPEVQALRTILGYKIKPFRPKNTTILPIKLEVYIYFDVKESAKWGKYKTTKPDCDNYVKELKDVMTDLGFWVDDAQVCSELTEKRWVRGIRKGGTASGIWISVREMEDNS